MKDFLKNSIIGVLMAVATFFVAEFALVDNLAQFALPVVIMAPILFKYLLNISFKDTFLNILVYFILKYFMINSKLEIINVYNASTQIRIFDSILVALLVFAIQGITLAICNLFDKKKIDYNEKIKNKTKAEKEREKEIANKETGVWLAIKFITMYAFAAIALIFLTNEVIGPIVDYLSRDLNGNLYINEMYQFIVKMSFVIVLNLLFLNAIMDTLFKEILTIRKMQNFTLIIVAVHIIYFAWHLTTYGIGQTSDVVYITTTFLVTSLVFILDRIRKECIIITNEVPEEKKLEKKKQEQMSSKVKGKKMLATYLMLYIVCLFAFTTFYLNMMNEVISPNVFSKMTNSVMANTFEILLNFAVIILFNYLFIKLVTNILMDKYKPSVEDMTYFKSSITVAITVLFLILIVGVFFKHIEFQTYIYNLEKTVTNERTIRTTIALFKMYDLANLATVLVLYITNISYMFFRIKKENKRIAKEEMAKRKKMPTTKKKTKKEETIVKKYKE